MWKTAFNKNQTHINVLVFIALGEIKIKNGKHVAQGLSASTDNAVN